MHSYPAMPTGVLSLRTVDQDWVLTRESPESGVFVSLMRLLHAVPQWTVSDSIHMSADWCYRVIGAPTAGWQIVRSRILR
jgi:hypothetical protein